MKKTGVLLFLLVATAIVGFACGGGEETKATATGQATAPTATATRQATAPTATPTKKAGETQSGQQLAQAKGCLQCHSTDGSPRVGPTWKGLYEKTRALQDGSTVTANEAYLLESIRSPNAKVAQGFVPNLMPAFTLTDSEIDAIVDYIESLQ